MLGGTAACRQQCTFRRGTSGLPSGVGCSVSPVSPSHPDVDSDCGPWTQLGIRPLPGIPFVELRLRMNSSTSCSRNRRSFPSRTAFKRGSRRVAWLCTQSAETPSQPATCSGVRSFSSAFIAFTSCDVLRAVSRYTRILAAFAAMAKIREERAATEYAVVLVRVLSNAWSPRERCDGQGLAKDISHETRA